MNNNFYSNTPPNAPQNPKSRQSAGSSPSSANKMRPQGNTAQHNAGQNNAGQRGRQSPKIQTTTRTPIDSDEIEYIIHGNDMQFVEVILDPEETVVAETGAMMYMEQGVQMETKIGDGSKKGSGVFGSLIGAAKRKMSGEDMFMTHFTNRGIGKVSVAFASPYPGQIIPIDLGTCGGQILCQKGGFLCGAKGMSLSLGFTKRIGAGMFGGEGYILQKITGDGLAFVHSGGTIVEKQIPAGKILYVDTGSVVGFESSIDFDIQMVKGVSNMMFGGENLFFSTLKGPGKVWIQSMPFPRLAATMKYAMIAMSEK